MMKKNIILTIIAFVLLGCGNSPKSTNALKEIGTMPATEEGFEQGVSACYAAIHNNRLYIAGGCNFPEIPAAKGGSKRYYKGIYSAPLGDTLIWEKAGTLPVANAYGANIQIGNKWIIAGGMNENGATPAVLCIDLDNNCKTDTLPQLPYSIDNTTGAVANGKIYVTGGNANGKPSNRTFILDLENISKGWEELPPMPSRARVQPVCAATADALYVWGGFASADSTHDALVHTDGARYDFTTNRWEQLPNISDDKGKFTLSGGTATLMSDSCIIAAGGVDHDIFTDAISGRYNLIAKDEYMHQAATWYRFNPRLMCYNINTENWSQLHSDATFARAGAIIISHNNDLYYIGGELKPGIRTPQIHRYRK